jgi:iron complex outermembrane receptor protein
MELARQSVRRKLRQVLVFGAFGAVGPSYAQTQAPTEAVEGLEVDEVIVTVQKREEVLQDVSSPIAVIGRGRLADSRIHSIEELQILIPNVTLGYEFNTAKLFMRGIGTNTSTSGSDPGVALNVDGVIVARPEEQLTSMFDLERIEVVRGPQGTLYGRNAVGGAINLVTAKPTPELTGYVRLGAGNYDAYGLAAAIGGPITEDILYRVAIQADERAGFAMNPVTSNDIDNLSRRMARIQLRVNASEHVETLLSLEGVYDNDNSGGIKYRAPSFPDIPALAPTGAGGFATNPRDLASEIDPRHRLRTWSATNTTKAALSDSFTLTNILNFRDFEGVFIQDLDASGVVNSIDTTNQATTIQNRTTYSRQASEELQLAYTSTRLSGVVGLYYFNERFGVSPNSIGLTPTTGQPQVAAALAAQGISPDQVFQVCGLDGLVGSGLTPPRFCGASSHGVDAYAAFGQVSYRVLPQLSIKLGGRYSRERRSEKNPGFIVGANGRGPAVNIFTTDPVGVDGGSAATGFIRGSRNEATFGAFTPEAGLEFRPAEGLMAYYTYAQGFKSGTGEATITNSRIIGPERVYNHELGLKASWLENRLITNLAAFHYDLTGLQVSRTYTDPVAGFRSALQNAAATSATGAELELSWLPVKELRMGASVAYLHSQFDDFVTADPLDPANIAVPPATTPANPVFIQLQGNPTRNSPTWVAAVHGEADLARLDNGGRLTVATDVTYKDRQYFSEFARALEGSKAYVWVDANLRYVVSGGQLSVLLWVKNATDVFRPGGTFALATAREIGVTYLQPRTYGFSVGYTF